VFPKFSDMYSFQFISFNSHSKFNADNKLGQSIFDRNMIYNASTIKNILHSKLSPSKKRALVASISTWHPFKVGRQNRRRIPRHYFRRNRGFAIDEMERLPDAIFRRMFRVDRETFSHLVQQLSPLIQRDDTYAINASGQPISVGTRLAVTLRWLAGGSSLDLCFAWGISRASFYSERGVLWPTIDAIDSILQIGLPIEYFYISY
jgi:hypothetical protein